MSPKSKGGSATGKPLLLLDGDLFVYRAISSAEKEVEFQPDLWVMHTNLADARDAFVTQMANITRKLPDHTPFLCLSDGSNFRKQLDPTYKGNRTQRKPMGFIEFRQWVMATYPDHLTKPSLEADDVMGILATKPGNDAVIWSDDKDMKQIPGKHLVDGNVELITQLEGDMVHLMQTLTGDPADGYKGCPGIGPKKAQSILEAADFKWSAVVDAYEKVQLTEADALLQARLARILRWSDWDQKKQEPILWSPNA